MRLVIDEGLRVFMRDSARICREAMGDTLQQIVLRVEKAAKRLIYKGAPSHLKGDTGRSRQSITHEVDWPKAIVGSPLAQMPAHEFGATIKPIRAKLLAIPIGDRKGSPRQYADLQLVKSKAGNLVLLDDGGKGQYVLKPEVVIPARPTFGPAIEEAAKDAPELFGRAMDEAMP